MSKKISWPGMILAFALGFLFSASVRQAFAEEKFEDLLKRAQEFKDQGNYSQAMAELSWAQKQLEKLHLTKLQEVFPKEVGGLTGGEFNSNSALGLISIERTYSGAGAQLKASLTGSAAAEGGAQQGMGMLSGLAGMAAMMGQTPGTETVRIKGNRGILQGDSGQLSLMVPLQSGMMIQIEPSGGKATKEQMIALAEGFNYDAIASLSQPK